MATFYELDSYRRDRSTWPNPLSYTVTADQVSSWTAHSRSIRSLGPSAKGAECLKKMGEDVFRTVNVNLVTLPYPRIELFAPESIDVTSAAANTFSSPDTSSVANGDLVITSANFLGSGLSPGVTYYVINRTVTTFQLSLTPAGVPITVPDQVITYSLPVVPIVQAPQVLADLGRAKQLLSFPRIYLDIHSVRYDDTRAVRTIGGILTSAKFVLMVDRIQNDSNGSPTWIHYRSSNEQTLRFRLEDPIVVAFYSRSDMIMDFFSETDMSVNADPFRQSLITIEVTPYSRDNSFRGEPLDD